MNSSDGEGGAVREASGRAPEMGILVTYRASMVILQGETGAVEPGAGTASSLLS